ncbi:MAG: exodeoxyribonuclease VII large subunit [Candidatus Cloacimonadota bacterium]|nr:MAG: exodeoxyribonuclease VII large subunit [Candidatus Cloacimonadota bacterium]
MNKPELENIFTVTEVTRHIKNALENNIPALWVQGEISNFKQHFSGHIYFSLKDENSSLRCVYFSFYNQYLRFSPQNGMNVLCYGEIKIYEKGGQYQLYVTKMHSAGIGDLEIAFRQLKEQLSKDGLFAEEHKKPLQKFPQRIGIVTSETGAALQDIINIISRRYPAEIILAPSRVQGENAANEIASAIELLNRYKKVDVIIVGRGGGSMEDLWCFNEKAVAYAIYNSNIPIISAVGHEIDFTIADFVADLRAPTPSAAAELVVPDRIELLNQIDNLSKNLDYTITNIFTDSSSKLVELASRLKKFHPQELLNNYLQQIDDISYRIHQLIDNTIFAYSHQIEILRLRLITIEKQTLSDYKKIIDKIKLKFLSDLRIKYLDCNRTNLQVLERTINKSIQDLYNDKKEKLHKFIGQLDELNPLAVLKRGYCISKRNDKIINSIKKINIMDDLEITFSDGKCKCQVQEKQKFES